MATADNVKLKIQGLINKSNETTGNADTDLTSAVNSLVEGYGKGGGEQPTLFPPIVTIDINNISWKNDTKNGGFNVSITAEVDGETVTSPLTVTEDMKGKTLIITASAENFESSASEIEIVYSSSTDVFLPYDTIIAKDAFRNNKTIQTVTAPNVITIEIYAFSDSSIKNVSMDKLQTIRGNAFTNCSNLTLTSLPECVTYIGEYAFANCSNLTLTSLPEGVTYIDWYAFTNCSNLTLTSLPEGVTYIGGYAFFRCGNLKAITFKGKPNTIESTAFSSCTALITINVPWAEGEVANAPWGATNATINYNYTRE